MTIFQKLGVEINNPVDAGGNQRGSNMLDEMIWKTAVEQFVNVAGLNSGLIFLTKAQLDTQLNYPPFTMAWVINDPNPSNNGIYIKSGLSGTGSWSKQADLPYSFIRIIDAGGGTPDEIVGTSGISLPSTPSAALLVMNVFAANTGPVTISVNGAAPKPLVTNTGNALAAGYLAAGMYIAFLDTGTEYRLLTDIVSSAIVAAAEAAAAEAEIWAGIAQGSVPNVFVTSRAAVKLLNTATVTNVWFDGDQWTWVASSFASILRTSVGTSSAVDAGTDTITINAHGLETGVAVLSSTTINGVTANTLVYAVVVDANNFKLAATYAAAVAAVPTIVDLTGTSAMTIWRHNDPAEGVIITKTGNISGTLGAWVRDSYAVREWKWPWFGIVGGLSTSGPDQAQAINAWMAAANKFKPFRTFTGGGLHGIDSRIHHPTHILGLWGARAGEQPTSIYRRFVEPNGPSIVSSAVNSTTETVTSNAHGLVTGDEVIVTAAVNGLAINTIYFVISVDANNYRLAATRTDAFAGTPFDLTGTSAMTVQKPSKRGNLALSLYGGDIRYITFQSSASLGGGGSGLSAILPSDVLRTGDLYIVDNYIASGAGSNFSIVIDGSANISPDPSGIGSNGMRDVRVKNNIIFGANIASCYLASPFGLDWDNSMKATITGGSGNSKMMYLIGAPDNRGYYASLKNDTPWTDINLDYIERSSITGKKSGALRNTVNVKAFTWLGEDDGTGIAEQNWVEDSGFSLDRRPNYSLIGPKITSTSELSTGHVLLASGFWGSKMAGTGDNDHAVFYNDALAAPTVVGRVRSNGSGTSFLTTSDQNLKDDLGEISAEKALEILRLMKFHEFDWIGKDKKRDWGVFAQELHEIYPIAVAKPKDDEKDMPWMVDYSKLVPVLGRAMQAMLNRQDDFETRLLALEEG